MGAFFKGWRRKVGVVLLGVSCLVFASWSRSKYVWDLFSFTIGTWQCQLVSKDEKLRWRGATVAEGERQNHEWFTIKPHPVYPHTQKGVSLFLGKVAQWETAYAGPAERHVEYSKLVLPLTLLSAYLILWKPRHRTQNAIAVIQSPQE